MGKQHFYFLLWSLLKERKKNQQWSCCNWGYWNEKEHKQSWESSLGQDRYFKNQYIQGHFFPTSHFLASVTMWRIYIHKWRYSIALSKTIHILICGFRCPIIQLPSSFLSIPGEKDLRMYEKSCLLPITWFNWIQNMNNWETDMPIFAVLCGKLPESHYSIQYSELLSIIILLLETREKSTPRPIFHIQILPGWPIAFISRFPALWHPSP